MSWKICLLSSALIAGSLTAIGQNAVGIGVVTPNKNAVLELVSPGNNQGLLVPRLTTVQRTATTFTSSLSSKENGLLVFDSDDSKFYYWQTNQWQPVRTGSDFTAGSGVTIAGNTIATVPQDLQLVGSTLTITNNTSATPISLAAFTGTNTDDQTLAFNSTTGQLSITRLSGGPQNVTVTGTTPGGTAGGDFSGTYPSPTIAGTSGNNIVAAINNAATTSLINTNRLNNSIVLDTESPTGGDVSGTFASGLTINNSAVTTAKIAPGTNGQVLTTAAGVATWANGASPTGTAGGDLTGTYPNPTLNTGVVTSAKILDGTVAAIDLATDAVTSAKILDGTITSADLNTTGITAGPYGSTTAVPSFTVDAQGRITAVSNTTITGVAPGGTAGGDLTGTYPNPTLNTGVVTSAKILDGTVAAIDLAADAVTTAKILDGTIAAADLATDAVTSAKILDATVAAADLAADAVTSTKILDGTVTAIDLAVDAVTTAKILDGTVASADMTTTGVTANSYGSATTVPVFTVDAQGRISAVTNTVISVTPSGTAGGDLTGTYPNPTLNTGVVTSAKILDGTIAAADLATDAVTSAKILDGTIAAVDLATDAVTTAKILDGTIAAADLATDAVTSAKILDGTIVNADISGTAAINVSKLSPGTSGQVLTTSAGLVAQWAAPGGTTLIQAPGTNNLFAGSPIGTTTTGVDNAFYGANTGTSNTTGNYNVMMGANAGYRKASGDLNIVIGWYAGSAITTGAFNGNTLVGAQAGEATTGGPNTFIGEKSGQANTSGTESVFVGNQAGITNTTGGRHTILGYQANVSTSGLQNSTAIGYQAIVDANNNMVFGNNAVVGWGFGVAPGGAAIRVGTGATNGNGATLTLAGAWTNGSDSTKKYNISTLKYGLSDIMKLRPVNYQWKKTGQPDFGFLAQEVKKILPEIVVGEEGQMSISYGQITAVLTKAVQEQQKEIEELKSKLSASQQQIKSLNTSVENLKSENSAINEMKAELEKIKKVLGVEANSKTKK